MQDVMLAVWELLKIVLFVKPMITIASALVVILCICLLDKR
jgi:hypothetical protein